MTTVGLITRPAARCYSPSKGDAARQQPFAAHSVGLVCRSCLGGPVAVVLTARIDLSRPDCTACTPDECPAGSGEPPSPPRCSPSAGATRRLPSVSLLRRLRLRPSCVSPTRFPTAC